MPEELILENSLSIIADEDVVLGFKALGFKVYPVRNKSPKETAPPIGEISNGVYPLKEPEELKKVLDEVLKEKVAICLVQDDIYCIAQQMLNSYKQLPLPIFIPFSRKLRGDLLDNIIKDIRLRATGAF